MLAAVAALEALLQEGAAIPEHALILEMLSGFSLSSTIGEAFGHPPPERKPVMVVRDDE